MKTFEEGQLLFWNDPDEGACSALVNYVDDDGEDEDAVRVKNMFGVIFSVYPQELEEPKDETADDYCPNSEDNKHEPDWLSVTTEYDGNQLYVDVNCKHCGKSGCIGTASSLKDNISW